MRKMNMRITTSILCAGMMVFMFGCTQSLPRQAQSNNVKGQTDTPLSVNKQDEKVSLSSSTVPLQSNSSEKNDCSKETPVCSNSSDRSKNTLSAISNYISNSTVTEKKPIALTSLFSTDQIGTVSYIERVGKEKVSKTLSETETASLLGVFNQTVFTPISYPWDVKLNYYSSGDRKFEIKTNKTTLVINLVCAFSGKGYVAVIDGDNFKTFNVPVESYNTLIKLG